MSTLRSALEELRVQDVRSTSDEDIAADLDEIEWADRVLQAERARRLAEVERRGSFGTDGHLSVTSWLADRHRVAPAAAAAQVRLARSLEQMPRAAQALALGEVSSSAVAVLAQAQQACPEPFAASEEELVEAARSCSARELRSAIGSWQVAADRQSVEEAEERRFERRALDIGPRLDGMMGVGGALDPETGQVVATALRAAEDADVHRRRGPDPRTPTQRRADALGQVCRWFLDRSDRPTVGGERPHVVVTVDLGSLMGRDPGQGAGRGPGGRRCELSDAGPISPQTARRWACDANLSRVITDAASEPLELGRKTKVVPASLRRALVVRDGGCTFPGCDRPPGWCDAHHIHHWADGGKTSLGNLTLQCRAHHRLVHHGRFTVQMVNGRPVYRRADGSVMGNERPQAPAERGPP